MTQRKIEIFSAGCPLCEETIELVNRIACTNCEITIQDVRKPEALARARELGVRSLPAVAIDGELAQCCTNKGPDETTLRNAGIGTS